MNFVKRHPIFATIITLLALLILAEVSYVQVLRTRVAAAEKDVHQRIAELDQLQRQKPTPLGENLRLARDDVARTGEVLANMLSILNVTGPDDLDFFKGEPATRPDAWFEISQFVDRMTTEARKSNVELKTDERFGFAAFANEGPEPAYIRSVYRQHRIAEYLLGKLFAARPRTLIAMQREEPVATVAPGAATPAASPGPAGIPRSSGPVNGARAPGGTGAASISEIFVIDPQISARAPGYVDTLAFRIIFLRTHDVAARLHECACRTGHPTGRAFGRGRGEFRGDSAAGFRDIDGAAGRESVFPRPAGSSCATGQQCRGPNRRGKRFGVHRYD